MHRLMDLFYRFRYFGYVLLGLIGLGASASFLPRSGFWVFLGLLVLLLLLLLGGFLLWKAWVRKKRSARLGGELQQHSSASPRDISDPGQRARLDDLRRKFQEGVKEYRARGKDLYKLPWYVIVGPPASGKTEAIRHCNVGFPPGMQDSLQGVGGTINMNWWFTNYGVILDTAGRLMFEQVKPGETSEWREFLNLLKKNRTNCPINGLFLTISVDSLIKDSAEEIAEKAGRIAQQLDLIQRILDVRFPVFVIVTKCDLLMGFREMFDGITDPRLQHQILGWSNPEPLDTAFRPEQIDEHLGVVVKRLRRRRLGLLRDPVSSEGQGKRRLDEVDALFSLPQSLALIGPRLRSYLETIFVAGEWSAKPLFLRGIYFTSSMREGSALDQELAQAIGVSVDDLPEKRGWERERAYFLRDLFVEKVFREKGLVTRAGNTTRMLRGRKLALYGTGFASLAIFVVLLVFGMKNFRGSVGDQSTYWQRATNDWAEWDKDRVWLPIITSFDNAYHYRGDEPKVDGLPESIGRAEFQARLANYTKNPIKLGVFSPLGRLGDIESERVQAQRIVFERSVIVPLLHSTRQEFIQGAKTESTQEGEAQRQRQADALAALIQLEARILRKEKQSLKPAEAAQFLAPLFSFLLKKDMVPDQVDTNLTYTMAWTYSEGDGKNDWPPTRFSGGESLTNNLAIARGLESFIGQAVASLEGGQKGLDGLKELREQVRTVARLETELNAKKDQDINQLMVNLGAAITALEASAKTQTQSGPLQGSPFSLADAYAKLTAASQSAFTNALQPIQGVLRDVLPATPAPSAGVTGAIPPVPEQLQAQTEKLQAQSEQLQAGAGKVQDALGQIPGLGRKEPALFVEIRARLEAARSGTAKTIQALSQTELAELAELDKEYFGDGGANTRHCAKRWALYQASHQAGRDFPFTSGPLIGEAWKPFLVWQTNLLQLTFNVRSYPGPRRENLTNTCLPELSQAAVVAVAELQKQYVEKTKARLLPLATFPLVRSTGPEALEPSQLLEAKKLLDQVSADLLAPSFQLVRAAGGAPLTEFAGRIGALQQVVNALLGANNIPEVCVVSLADPKTVSKTDDFARGLFRFLRLNGEDKKSTLTPLNNDWTLGKLPVTDKLTIDLFRTVESPVGRSAVVGNWGALRLLLEHVEPRASETGGGKVWRVNLPGANFTGQEVDVEGLIPLNLEFVRPLPDPAKWPTRKNLEDLSAR